MKDREYIAYQGDKHTIEWYFAENGNSQAFDYYNSLESSQRIKLLYLLKRMGDIGKINDSTKFNNEGDKIFAFKPKPDRFLCFFESNGKIILTNAFRKKQQKLPETEKEKALAYKKSYERRVKEGIYYV